MKKIAAQLCAARGREVVEGQVYVTRTRSIRPSKGKGAFVVIVRTGQPRHTPMSRQSFAVNNSGALTGTRPSARISGPTLMLMSGEVRRVGVRRNGVSTTMVVGPGGRLVVEPILVREMMNRLYS